MKAEKEHIDELIVSYLSNELDGNAVHEPVSYTHLDVYKRQLLPV